VLEHLPRFESSLARALCWGAMWDMVRDAELASREFVRLVCSALPLETDINLVTSILRQVRTAIDLYADPEWASDGRQQLAEAARAMLDSTNSGLQLVWARALIWTARNPTDIDLLRAWLSDKDVPGGLIVDAELRWDIVSGLVALGAAGEPDIAAEEQRDATSSGAQAAATARALIPAPEAKAEAWRRLTTEALPNWLQRALLDAFYHSSQLALTRPFVPRYFEAIGPLWATHDVHTVHAFVSGAFPTLHVEQAVVEASDAWLADESQPQSARRLVQEGRDGVIRALEARRRDATT